MRICTSIRTNFHEDQLDINDVNEIDSTKSDIELPARSLSQRWRRYGHDAKRRVFERFSKWCPKGTATSNLFIYLKTDQTFPEFVLKSVIGFFGGIVLTYLCFVFFMFQLSISLIHATIMSSIIGVLLTFGLAFSYRIRCLVFLLIPQLFSRVGRYTLTCYALILILTGPATNTLKNSEVLTGSMACTQEHIKTDIKQITDSMKKPFTSMKDAITVMIEKLNAIAYKVDEMLAKINRLVISIVDVLQSSYIWLYDVVEKCNEKFGTPYEHCIKVLTKKARWDEIRNNQERVLPDDLIAKTVCSDAKANKVCRTPEYDEESIAATIKRKLRTFMNRVKAMFFIKIHMHHSYSFTSNCSRSPSQVTAGIVTEIRNRADPLLTWLSWSSCITSLFLLLIIFRAKYYQHMFETHSRFDNRYITKELRDLDLVRLQEGKETVLPLNRRERAKYVTTTSFRLVATEKFHLTRSIVFMAITTFKLMIHMIADYSLYWVLMTIRYHGKRQTQLPPGPKDAGLLITGTGLIADISRSIFKALTTPLLESSPPMSCLPDPYPPDLKRYMQIGVLIFFLWFFALFEPYGLRLRHLIMGHYRPERAKTRAAWLYNHILRTRGSFMKFARRKLHREFKYMPQENYTFGYWLRTRIPFRWLRCILGIGPLEPKCLLCNANELENTPNSDLIRCENQNCPGIFCNSCFSDIGRLCTICLSPIDYGDFSDISLEKGSSDDSEDSSSTETCETNLLPKRKYFIRSSNARDSKERCIFIGNEKQHGMRKPRFNSSNQNIEDNDRTPLLYTSHENVEDNICNKYLTAKTLDLTCFSVPKNNITVGFVHHNYFCNNNFLGIPSNILPKYGEIVKTCIPNLSENSKVRYGTFEKSLDKQIIKEIEIDKCELFESKLINPIENNLNPIENPSNIRTNYDVAKIYSTGKPVRKKSRKKVKLQIKIRRNQRRRNKMTIFNPMRQKLNKILYYATLPMTGVIKKLNSANIHINLYDIKKSSSIISVSKISLSRRIRYHRKSTHGKINGLQRGTPCTNNVSNLQLHVDYNTPERDNLPFESGNQDLNNNDNTNICDNKGIPKIIRNKTNPKTCFSIKIIKRLFSNIMVKTCLDEICYSNKKSFKSLKNKHNYKRRKKYLHQKIKKENATNKTIKIRNENELTREYRISAFLKEGDWLKGQFGEEASVSRERENRRETLHDVEYYGVHFKSHLPGFKKSHIRKASKHLSCTCNCDGICSTVKTLDLEVDDRCEKKSAEVLTCNNDLPIQPKCNSHEQNENRTDAQLKCCSSVKSFSIKNVKMYIANKFLHLKFGNSITVMKTFFSTISLAKEKKSKTVEILQDKNTERLTFDKDVTASPIVKSCMCQCDIIKHPVRNNPDLYRLVSNPNLKHEHTVGKSDKQTQTEPKVRTCATQYSVDNVVESKCDSFIHDLYKDYKKDKKFTSDSTRSDTTTYSYITIDYVDETPKAKDKRTIEKTHVITKSSQSTLTDKTNLRNASTVTSDWWSPIVEKKEINYKTGDHGHKKRRETKPTQTSINRKLVTFKSRTHTMPKEESYILSPSRYLLESQKYYNELFSPRFYGSHLLPVNRSTQQKQANVCKNHTTKRLEQRRSSEIKIDILKP